MRPILTSSERLVLKNLKRFKPNCCTYTIYLLYGIDTQGGSVFSSICNNVSKKTTPLDPVSLGSAGVKKAPINKVAINSWLDYDDTEKLANYYTNKFIKDLGLRKVKQ